MQSLTWYLPQQVFKLCQQANLEIVGYFPNGAMNFETWHYYEPASKEKIICTPYIHLQKNNITKRRFRNFIL